MDSLEAAYKILEEAGQPLHSNEITRRMLAQALWTSAGKTPSTTVNSRISVDIKANGIASRFQRVGPSTFAINSNAIQGALPGLSPGVPSGIQVDLRAYHRSIADELASIRNRIRQLIGDAHWLTDGEYKEAILRRVLRNHVPEVVRVGTGFVCYSDGTASNQIDILLTDTRKPTLFKDDELVIVTADAVRAMIEIKTKQTNTTLRETLIKLADNAQQIRQNAQGKRCMVGLFIHEAGRLSERQILLALHHAAQQDAERASERVVDFVAVGSNFFAQYSEEPFRGKGGEAPLWYLYNLNNLAPAYFVSHFVWRTTEDRLRNMRFAWFPLQGEVRNLTHFCISLHSDRIQQTDITFER